MRTSLILAAAVAVAAAGGAVGQERRDVLPESLGSPDRAPGNTGQFRAPFQDREFYSSGQYNDLIIRQTEGGRCWLRYVAYNADTRSYRYGEAMPVECTLSIAEAVVTSGDVTPGITLAELQASAGVGPLAQGGGTGIAGHALPVEARTGQGTNVSATVPEYGYRPLTFDGTWQEWQAHQDACDARYRTYDRSTDTFYATPGHRHFCNIGLKEAPR